MHGCRGPLPVDTIAHQKGAMEDETSRGRALFVYGTLLFPSILERLLGHLPLSSPGRAEGYVARTMLGATYPGMVRSSSDAVDGALLEALTNEELELLDAYEGWPYERVEIEVTLAARQSVRALAFVVDNRHVSQSTWDRQLFADRHLQAFLETLDEGGSSAARHHV